MDNKNFTVIEVPNSNKTNWFGGAWCLVYVYSTKGNFLLKGYRKECKDYIKSKNWKCWAVFNLYCNKKHRTIIETFNCSFSIHPPILDFKKGKTIKGKKINKVDYKFRLYFIDDYENKNALWLKRLPNKFVNFLPNN